jgi:alkane 1-monooxygenase
MVGGLSIAYIFTLGHELVHKDNKFDEILGTYSLLPTYFTHYQIDHVQGHHRYVATPEDPSTARLNQTVFDYIPKSFIGEWKSAWKI